jgi:uncharacterized membrane protein YbjE (DUF340 family)
MLPVLISLAFGILLGVILRRRAKVLRTVDRLTTWFIYLFLFLLGLTVGLNRAVFANFGRLGLQAVAIAVACVAGSLLPAFFVYRFFYAPKKK